MEKITLLLQSIRKIIKRNKRQTVALLVLAVLVLSFFNLMQTVYAKSQVHTTYTLDKTQVLPDIIIEKKIEIKPGLALADKDKLNIDHDPEAIKAYIEQIAPEYGVDWKLVYAIGAYESGYFKSDLAKNNNNFFGRKANSTSWMKYDTAEEGIRDQFLYIKEHYIANGLDTPQKMNRIYCVGDTWQYKVQTIMNSV